MTGFRVALGGAQQLLGLTPDITAIGKVVGGGMPLAAFGGKAEIMDYLSPNGSVYQAGTLSGNPIAVTSGLATLELIQKTGFYEAINNISSQLTTGLQGIADDYSIPFCTDFVGGMFGFYFSDKLPENLKEVKFANEERFNKFFHMMLDAGVYFAPSMYEAGFVCIAHSNKIIEQTLGAAKKVFAKL